MQGALESNNTAVRLFFSRLILTLIIFFALYWLNQPATQHEPSIRHVAWLWLTLLFLQSFLFIPSIPKTINIGLQLFSDLILIGAIIYISGGIFSPFILLLGLVIIVAGAQANVTLPLIIAVLAAGTYIITVYSYASLHDQSLTASQSLKLLLQTSLFFLTGAIMALISRRQERLFTENQESSLEHKQLQEVHRQILSSMHEAILIFDSELLIQAHNTAASTMLGISPHHKGYRLDSFIDHPNTLSTHLKQNTIEAFRFELKQGNQHLLASVTNLADEMSTWLMTIVDITEVRELENKLAEQDKLASIGQMAAMLAHEIRNPLQTISQAAELMGLQQTDKKLERIITSEVSRLNRLVSDMLDYANPLTPQPKHIEISKVIHNTVHLLDMDNYLDIKITCAKAMLHLDGDHFHLVLDNLLRNAIHASPSPHSIHVSFELLENEWVLRIQDEGSGIDAAMKKKLFLPFHTGHTKGTGLGLATVWQVCQVNGWSISIDESVSSGACFVITSHKTATQETGENTRG